MNSFINWLKRNTKIIDKGNLGVSNRNELVKNNLECFLWDAEGCKGCALKVLAYEEVYWE